MNCSAYVRNIVQLSMRGWKSSSCRYRRKEIYFAIIIQELLDRSLRHIHVFFPENSRIAFRPPGFFGRRYVLEIGALVRLGYRMKILKSW